LTERRIWNAIYGSGITNKWVYTYDLNGNMTEVSKQNGASVQTEKWLYTWNPRDQLTKVEKRTGTGAGTYAGQVEYAYCLSCDGALAYRKEYDQTSETSIRRYEYDGLKLLRVDEVYDSDSDNDLDDDYAANGGLGNWRTVEASTYGPGIVGNLLGKVVYTHTDDDATPDSQADYYYHYDHVGNVYLVTDDEGEEVYRFSQDAFGNELDFGNYTGDSWATAAAAGIGEHQTGKWIDDFSGLYFFHARWYDSEVGRFLSRDTAGTDPVQYRFCESNPINSFDPNGLFAIPLWSPFRLFNPWRGITFWLARKFSCAGSVGLAFMLNQSPDPRHRLPDKQLHCIVGCITAQECGMSGALIGAYMKELFDLNPWTGTPDFNYDVNATIVGALLGNDCDDHRSCEEKCQSAYDDGALSYPDE
jgi:RHS repeat-associated protein